MSDNTDYERETFSVEVCTVLACQYDQSYRHASTSDEVCVAEFDDWDEAYEFFMSYALDQPEVTTTRNGLDSVTYGEARIYSNFWEDGEVVDSLCQDVRCSLTAALRDAMNTHEREYHEFLDYKRDHYHSLRDIIEATDDGRE